MKMKKILGIIAKMFPSLAVWGRGIYYWWLPEIKVQLLDDLENHIIARGFVTKELYFVQVGAHDGACDDPIAHLLSKYNDWKGILMEPQSLVFNQLRRTLGYNERFTFLNAALSDTDGKQVLYKIAFSESDWATGLASFDLKSLRRSIENGYVKHMAETTGDPLPEKEENFIKEELVTTISYETLISMFERKPDLFVLDTEGYDYHLVNRLIDNNVLPLMWWLEYSYMSIVELKQLIKRLRRLGYSVERSQWDLFACKR